MIIQLVLVRHVLMLTDRSVVPLRMVFGSYQVVFLKTMLATVLEKLDQEIQVLFVKLPQPTLPMPLVLHAFLVLPLVLLMDL